MTNLFLQLYHYLGKRKWLLLCIAAVWSLLCLFFITRISFDENIASAFPNAEQLEKSNKILKNSPFLERMYLVFKKKTEQADESFEWTERVTFFVEQLDTAHQKDYIKSIKASVDDEVGVELIDFVHQNLPYYLSENDYSAIDSLLAPNVLEQKITEGFENILTPAGIAMKRFYLKDPLFLFSKGLKTFEKLSFNENFQIQNGLITTKDGGNVLAFLQPSTVASNTLHNEKMLEHLDKAIRQTQAQFQDVEIIYFGGPAMSVANAKQIRKDVFYTVGTAILLLILIITWYFRRIYAFPILLLPVAFGALNAMAFLALFKGSISVITLGIGSVMLGIIIDYSLHVFTHYRENGNMEHTLREVVSPLMTTCGTNVLAFSCLLFLSSKLMNDIGLFVAVSTLTAALFSLIFLPHFLGKKYQEPATIPVLSTIAKFPLHQIKWLAPVLLVTIVVATYLSLQIGFDADLDKMSYQTEKLAKAENYLDEISNFKLKNIYLVSEGNSMDEVLEKNQQFMSLLDSLKQTATIESYTSLNIAWPSLSEREKKLSQWNAFWEGERTQRLKETLQATSKKLHIKSEAFDGFIAWIQTPKCSSTEEAMDFLQPLFFEDVIQKDAQGNITLISILRANEANKSAVYKAFGEDPFLFDGKSFFSHIVKVLQDDFLLLEWLSFILVLAVVLLSFWRFELAFSTMIPMLAAWSLTLGGMVLLGVDFNIFNIIICTFIFGLGVDYSVFLGKGILNTYRGENESLSTYKMSILLSIIVNQLAVGVLIFAKHPALQSIATVSVLGLLVTGFISFALLPRMFHFFLYKKGKPRKQLVSVDTVFSSLYSIDLFIQFAVLLVPIGIILRKVFRQQRAFEKLSSLAYWLVMKLSFFIPKKLNQFDVKEYRKPAVIVANHQSGIDLLMVSAFSSKLKIITKAKIFNVPVLGKLVRMLNYYSDEEAARPEFVEKMRKDMEKGYSILFFAEGTRSEDMLIHRLKKGAFLVAEKLKADILPVLIHGTGNMMPKGTYLMQHIPLGMKTLQRIEPGVSEGFAADYHLLTKQVQNYMREEMALFRAEIETPYFMKKALKPMYAYRASHVRMQYLRLLKQDWKKIMELHDALKEQSLYMDVENSYAVAAFLCYKNAKRNIYIYAANEEVKAEVVFLQHWYPQVQLVNQETEFPQDIMRLSSAYFS